LSDFPDKKEEDFATIYGGVSSCFFAGYFAFSDKKPKPGCMASAPMASAALKILDISR